jgi:endonuclease/exonuclease/phosphatase family metal-dependent hydrolase
MPEIPPPLVPCFAGGEILFMIKLKSFLGKTIAGLALGVLLVGSLVGCTVAKEPTASQTFRVMTYNIHHGEGLDGKVDLERIAAVIKESGADIIALQEVDKGVERTARRDLPAELAALTGFTCVFSNNYHHQGGEYGNAVLTRFAVKSAVNHHFKMLQAREPRGLQKLVLDVAGREVVFLNTHLDASREDTDRWSSAGEIETILKSYAGRPLLICGDFNATPESRVIRKLSPLLRDTWLLAGKGDGFTVPVNQPRRRIDYLWMSKDAPFVPRHAWVPHSDASDHLPIVVEFEIP